MYDQDEHRSESLKAKHKHTHLLVREHLASSREVIIAFDEAGLPVKCWDERSFPGQWLKPSCWHQSGVTFQYGSLNCDPSNSLLGLNPGLPIEMAKWLSRTYRFYDSILGENSVILSSKNIFLAEVSKMLGKLPLDSVIIEIGGSSLGKTRLQNQITSVDPRYCESNEAKVDANDYNSYLKEGIIEDLPFPSCYADCILCVFVLEHIIEPLAGIKEIVRVLKPQGKLILGIPIDQSAEGSPPFFHRWRFSSASSSNSGRTLLLKNFDLQAEGLLNMCGDNWVHAAGLGTSKLFLFHKTG